MITCELCGNEIQSGARHYSLNGHNICAECARVNTLEEISFFSSELDCTVIDELIPTDYTLKA